MGLCTTRQSRFCRHAITGLLPPPVLAALPDLYTLQQLYQARAGYIAPPSCFLQQGLPQKLVQVAFGRWIACIVRAQVEVEQHTQSHILGRDMLHGCQGRC
jgi:hypothetical protein